jgi:hypothetical protein
MEEYTDKLKDFYELKSKSKRGKKKSAFRSEFGGNIEFEKIPYSYNKDYLKNIEDKLLEEKNKMITLKYDVLYSLDYDLSPDSVEELYDQIEENIKKLKDARDKIKLKMYQKEERKKKEIKQINDAIEILRFNYREIPEDRKELYLEIQVKREEINDIYNKDRCIIVNEENKKNIYVVTTDYEPIKGNEILIDSSESNLTNSNLNESNSNNSNSNNSNDSNNSNVSIESENLE